MGSSHSSEALYDSYVESKFEDLTGKVVAITGTTSGSIGYYLAKAAVAKNAKCVILLNRQSERSVKSEEEIKEGSSLNTTVQTVTIDLLSFDSVKEAAEELNQIAQQHGGLDILACNAGIMAQADQRSGDGYDVQMQANQLSHYYLTKLCMGSLESAAESRGEARVVYHSSSARSGGMKSNLEQKYFEKCNAGTLGGDAGAAWERYHQSKLANSAFAMALHDKLKEKGSKVKALACDPGFANSNLIANSGSSQMIMGPLKSFFKFVGYVQSPADGSLPIGMCCYSKDAESGDFYMPSGRSGFVGDPKKTVSGGVAVKEGGEEQTVSAENKKVVMEACEKVFGFTSTL